MKANELMIGDWVHMEAHRGFEAQNIRVESIPDASSDGHFGHIGAYPVSEDMDFRDIEDTHLSPIELRQGILEKYDMYYRPNENRYVYENPKGFRERIAVLHVASNIWEAEIRGRLGQVHISIGYVHQLQHALRLCGIDKEIIILN